MWACVCACAGAPGALAGACGDTPDATWPTYDAQVLENLLLSHRLRVGRFPGPMYLGCCESGQECWHGRTCKPLPLLPGCTAAHCRTARGKIPGEVASAVRYWRWLRCDGVRWRAARAAAPALADATAGWERWRLYELRLQLLVPAASVPPH